MLFYLLSSDELGEIFARLGYDYDEGTIPQAVDYYLERTAHGSTLSRVVHAWVLARSDRSRSWEFFLEALESDISDTQGGTTAEGIHLGAMVGTLDLLQRCYTGLEVRDDVLWLNPQLPTELRRLTFTILYRGQLVELDFADDRVTVVSQTTVAPRSRSGSTEPSRSSPQAVDWSYRLPRRVPPDSASLALETAPKVARECAGAPKRESAGGLEMPAASVLQASRFRGDATVFRLSAAYEAESRLEPALRRNPAARIDSPDAAHNPEVAGSNPAPAIQKGPGNGAFRLLSQVFTAQSSATTEVRAPCPGRPPRRRRRLRRHPMARTAA